MCSVMIFFIKIIVTKKCLYLFIWGNVRICNTSGKQYGIIYFVETENCAVYEIVLKNLVEPQRSQVTVCWVSTATCMQVHALAHQPTHQLPPPVTHTHTHKRIVRSHMRRLHFFSTTMVLWTCLSIVLYTHCLSGFHSDKIHNFVWVGTPSPVIWYKDISVPAEDTSVVFGWLCQLSYCASQTECQPALAKRLHGLSVSDIVPQHTHWLCPSAQTATSPHGLT